MSDSSKAEKIAAARKKVRHFWLSETEKCFFVVFQIQCKQLSEFWFVLPTLAVCICDTSNVYYNVIILMNFIFLVVIFFSLSFRLYLAEAISIKG